MKKRGFTLIELMGVITILGLIAILVAPTIINQIKKSQNQLDEVTKQLIFSAADLYLDNRENDYPKENGLIYCLELQTLVDDGKLSTPLLDSNGNEIKLTDEVTVIVRNGNYSYKYGEKCEE